MIVRKNYGHSIQVERRPGSDLWRCTVDGRWIGTYSTMQRASKAGREETNILLERDPVRRREVEQRRAWARDWEERRRRRKRRAHQESHDHA